MTRKRGNGSGTLFKRTPSGAWLAAWYDANGRRQTRSTGTTDRAAAERILRHHVTTAALRREGVIDTRAEAIAEHARRPLAQHLADFRAGLEAKGGTARHVDLVTARAQKVIDGAGFATWGDVSASRVMQYLGDLRKDQVQRNNTDEVVTTKRGISAQTFNFYLQAVKQFARWMVKDRRAADNPLAHLDGLNVRTDRRHDRRALSADELRALIATTERDDVERHGMGARERAMVYRLAVETGLRAGELRSLTRASFRLDPQAGEPATVTVAAAYSKRRRADTLPLRPAMVDLLRDYLATKAPAAPAFNVPDRHRTAAMIAQDLEAAGIPVKDHAGRCADFHALRHTFISNLAAGGVHPKTAQTLARHSTITLTMDRYTHQYAGDELEALAALPDLTAPGAEAGKATGTDAVATLPDAVSSAQQQRQQRGRKTVRTGATGCDGETLNMGAAGAADGEQKALESAGKCEPVRLDASQCETERVGFEPTVDTRSTPVFETGATDRIPREKRQFPEKRSSSDSNGTEKLSPADPHLARLVEAWPTLPPAIRAGILAMVEAAKREG